MLCFIQTILHNSFFIDKRLVTGLYCLLTGKPELLYDELFVQIIEIAQEKNKVIRATKAMVDFEIAIRNSLRSHFPLMVSV